MAAVLLLFDSCALAQQVRIAVLGLFHPREFTLHPVAGEAIALHTGHGSIVLERTSATHAAEALARGFVIELHAGNRLVQSQRITVTGRDGRPADFLLTIPGKITRRYHGILDLQSDSGVLEAVVTMDLETAVTSVVAAESLPDEPLEALKAQAVAARSYLTAGKGRHSGFDFCDTTHCQFLRAAPAAGPASQAAVATRRLVLVSDSRPFTAMYTRSCSGRTRTPAELALPPAAYSYYPVECSYCRQNPIRWRRRISPNQAEGLRASNEASRLRLNRILGWSTVPSNSFALRRQSGQVVLEGVGEGHGIGLCQMGARAMAEQGADFRRILAHYYPNATIGSRETASPP